MCVNFIINPRPRPRVVGIILVNNTSVFTIPMPTTPLRTEAVHQSKTMCSECMIMLNGQRNALSSKIGHSCAIMNRDLGVVVEGLVKLFLNKAPKKTILGSGNHGVDLLAFYDVFYRLDPKFRHDMFLHIIGSKIFGFTGARLRIDMPRFAECSCHRSRCDKPKQTEESKGMQIEESKGMCAECVKMLRDNESDMLVLFGEYDQSTDSDIRDIGKHILLLYVDEAPKKTILGSSNYDEGLSGFFDVFYQLLPKFREDKILHMTGPSIFVFVTTYVLERMPRFCECKCEEK